MVSSRFSGKTHAVEELFVLLLLQPYKRIVLNYVRARGEDVFKAMDTFESRLLDFSGGQVKVKPNMLKKHIKYNQNKINFTVLNEIKEKVSKTGGKIGVPIEYNADYIITFYEEASQLEKELTENHQHSVRGNEKTQKLFIYASNPWMKTHWLISEMARNLPEDEKMEKELEERGFNAKFDKFTKTLYYRPRFSRNYYVEKEQINEIALLKEVNYPKWRIVSLGFSGLLSGSLYGAALEKLNTEVDRVSDMQLYGGIDWGDGKSGKASPTIAYIMGISQDHGVHIFEEYEWANNTDKGVKTTDEQLQSLCEFFFKWHEKRHRKITIFIDNAALGDFFFMAQTMAGKMGYSAAQLEFLPAYKRINTWERVEVVNLLLSLGFLRFHPQDCPGLYEALKNCYEVEKTNPTEEMKRQRSHEWTHWIHALEYGIGEYFVWFQMKWPILLGNKNIFNDNARL